MSLLTTRLELSMASEQGVSSLWVPGAATPLSANVACIIGTGTIGTASVVVIPVMFALFTPHASLARHMQ